MARRLDQQLDLFDKIGDNEPPEKPLKDKASVRADEQPIKKFDRKEIFGSNWEVELGYKKKPTGSTDSSSSGKWTIKKRRPAPKSEDKLGWAGGYYGNNSEE